MLFQKNVNYEANVFAGCEPCGARPQENLENDERPECRSNSMGLTSERLKVSPGESASVPSTQDKSSRRKRAARDTKKVASNRHATSENASPFVLEQEIACEECGGSGRDIGSLDPWDGDDCANCAGSGRQTITRNYLAEAFLISANPESTRPVERQHLVAVIQHCRELVGALMSFPEVA